MYLIRFRRSVKNVIKKVIKKYFVLLLTIIMFLLTLIFSVSGIENNSVMSNNSQILITEIMFNPEGSDTGREWIELYIECDVDINISRYRFNESNIKHNIYPYNEEKICGYVIICNNCELFYSEYFFNSSDNNIQNISLLKSSFSLSNTGEYLSILEDDVVLFETDYSGVNASEGKSIILINNKWIESESGGTPGYLSDYVMEESTINNTLIEKENNTINDTIEINDTETNISNNITLNNTSLNNTIIENHTSNTIIENITTNNTTLENNTLIKTCQINLSIEVAEEEQYYDRGTKILFYNRLSVTETDNKLIHNIEYWIEDLFGNIVKNSVITNNLNQKSYTPKIDEADKVLIIKNRLINVSCNISNDSILEYSKIIIIKNEDFQEEECELSETGDVETLENTESYMDIIITESGKNYEIAAEIYRGNTRKTVTDIYLKDGSGKVVEKYHTKINKQYCSMEFVWSINKEKLVCDEEYTLLFEGLGLVEEKLLIKECLTEEKDTLIIEKIQTKTQTLTSEQYGGDIKNLSNENITLKTYNHSNQITGESIYESANQKNRRYSLIGIIILVLIGLTATGLFLWKKYLKKT